MPVLSKLREQTKFWMWIVGGSFILMIVFAWGMDYSGGGASSSVGKVNGRKVTIQEYQAALQQAYSYQRNQLGGREMDASMTEYIQEQTWQQMVNEILIAQQLHKMGLGTSDEEVLMVLREHPPSFMRTVPNFQTDGIFDPQKYQAAMNNENFRYLWLQAEALVRDMIPQTKLEHLIAGTALVTEKEAEELYRYRSEKASATFVALNPDTSPDSILTVSDAEIQSYYSSHREDYREPERVEFNYVLLYHDPSPRDLADVQERLSTIERRLKEGDDFSVLARQFSEDPTAGDGGDLGWVSKGDMVSSFEEKAFGIDVGTFSDPIRTQYGWHVIQVDSIRAAGTDDEQRKLRHILIEEIASPTTLDSLRTVLDQLRTNARESDFTTAASRLGLEVQTTGPVAQSGFIPGIGFEPNVIRFGFANRIGDISEVMEHTSAYYVVQVRDKLEEGIAPLADVRSGIRSILLTEKRMNALGETARELADRLRQDPARFSQIVEAAGLTTTETGSVTRNDYISGVSRDPQFIAALFTAPIGSVTEAIRGENSWYILKILERTEISTANIASLIADEQKRLLQDRRQSAFNAWLQGLRSQAKIVDSRSNIFY
jgi:peptidyl-prolyl cis-trans isomerase D